MRYQIFKNSNKQKNMTGTELTSAAYQFGRDAYQSGKKRIPYHDKNLMVILDSIEDQPTRVDIYNAWYAAWDNANINDVN